MKKIAIVGLGLIGGSLGLAFKKNLKDWRIIGIARRQETIDEALKLKAIDEGTTSIVEGVKDADLVFISTPVGSIVEVAEQVIPAMKTGGIITDVGSTKAEIVRAVEEILPEEVFFVGGHPMAGSERHGIEAASEALFQNAFYLLTPTSRTNGQAFQTIHAIVTQIGANVVALDPERHDRIVATISHLPHLVASALVNLASAGTSEEENILLFAASGFRDMTRIAAGNPNIWLDICLANAEAIRRTLQRFSKSLIELDQLLQRRDTAGLRRVLEGARQSRLNLPALLHKDLAELRVLSIPVIDRPGVLSEITVTVGHLGINIEDIELVHSEGRGVLKLTLRSEENAGKAAEALRKKGYQPAIGSAVEDA